ncbi:MULTISPECIES: hypothetical protein [Pectobacterium]|uniref:hypothetical protein n=1 Tax=Pectobacterium TaxID=122277 RepID=UPI000DAB36A7|nr:MULTISPECIES: hypothetical protein [Pectobacterium]MBL0868457.1 hypothetical protein [Pectobacterium carotovorum]MCA6917657.1 hypothetical protein [Pectobacterium versatile]RJL46667.1 hypothetical protein D5078_11095 [Pectobacterium carotovorum]GBO47689.1 hypothetical protein MFFDBJGM_00692 [Pectobacterium versatile]
MQRKIKVESVNLNAKCWVVRPGTRYKFAKEFISDSFVAIGHLDGYLFGEKRSINSERDLVNISEIIDSDKFTRNVRSQVLNFISDMNVGDVIFTMTSSQIIPGVIKSEPYYDPNTIRIQQKDGETFSVRRDVEWGSIIDRKDVPLTISRSFLAYQAVFSLGNYSTEVFHWLSSFFIDGDGYYSSLRIEQKGSINHHALKALSEVIDRIQVIALLAENNNLTEDISLEYLKEQMEVMYEEGRLTLTAQQMLMSPGDFWLGLNTKSKKSGVIFLLLMALIVGEVNNVSFASEDYKREVPAAQAIIEKHGDIIKEGINIEKMKAQLMLETKKQNNKFVEANPNDFDDGDVPKDVDPSIVSN